ncbi:Hypothetical protein R9X50_00306500 [Acrodontium crateriforme]|uniref:glucan endo-1,3-beta-D-glucosidase n=1 Tax=Acrodontium crateriforme TaxID=150365 RepID=A0AAQ3M8C1_9PEZI|nr:Hypothetical protein R9X50_00306500 [Acrodontium crateriforme]
MAKARSQLPASSLISLLALAHLQLSSAIPVFPRYANTTTPAASSQLPVQLGRIQSSIDSKEVKSSEAVPSKVDLSSFGSTTYTAPEVVDRPTNIVQQTIGGQMHQSKNLPSTASLSSPVASRIKQSPAMEAATKSVPTTMLVPATPARSSDASLSVNDGEKCSTWIWGSSVGPYETDVQASSTMASPFTSTVFSTVTMRISSAVLAPDLTIPGFPGLTNIPEIPEIAGLSNIPTAITVGTLATVTVDIPAIATVPDAFLTSLSTLAVQQASSSLVQTMPTGPVETALQTSGEPSLNPFPTIVLTSTSALSIIDVSTIHGESPTAVANTTALTADNIFQPIATEVPPAQISSRADHPVARLGIQSQSGALETNKFYANFFLGGQNQPTWTHPYSVGWSKGQGSTKSWGLSVSHIERNQLYTGSAKKGVDAGDWAWFASPIGVQSLVLSAAELGNGTKLTTDHLQAFSVNVNLIGTGGKDPLITFPLVQGMGFITAVYRSGTPLLQSGVGISNLTYVGSVVNGNTFKYRATLQDGFTWFIYITPENSNYKAQSFTLLNPGLIQGPSGFGGYIQVAKAPANTPDVDKIYDGVAGAYATSASITGSVEGITGSYTLSWTKQGVQSQKLLMFALPHHISSFSDETRDEGTEIKLETTTKGVAMALTADSWTLNEPNLPVNMGFSPWKQDDQKFNVISAQAISIINRVGTSELSQNIAAQTNVGSLYYDGKALAKFATICYTLHDIGGNASLALTGLQTLKAAMEQHINNQMTYPLVYDSAWGGVVSVSSYNSGNSGDDFGNTYYNDHHFHYGYFVYAAAIIGYLDPNWLSQGSNKAWVNMLVRDYANSVSDDQYFPFSRMFDWYHGHSWAHGVMEASDGKDQESSSEDTMASYALKMWGLISGDKNMEARGNLMLAIQARSLSNYYLYQNESYVEPESFIGNKAGGIMFENKIDHTTYFGADAEYIQGIHMLPLMPFSSYTRPAEFVKQEWNVYFSDNGLRPASTVPGGWKGVLMANYALVDPTTAYNFFTNQSGDFDSGFLDGGASQTWYVAWAAGLGGSVGGTSNDKRDEMLGDNADMEIIRPDSDGQVSIPLKSTIDGDEYRCRKTLLRGYKDSHNPTNKYNRDDNSPRKVYSEIIQTSAADERNDIERSIIKKSRTNLEEGIVPTDFRR